MISITNRPNKTLSWYY